MKKLPIRMQASVERYGVHRTVAGLQTLSAHVYSDIRHFRDTVDPEHWPSLGDMQSFAAHVSLTARALMEIEDAG